MKINKKVMAGQIRFILPEAIGKVRTEENVDRETIARVLQANP